MKKLIYPLYLFLMVILLGELLFFLTKKEKQPPYNTAEIEEVLGWKPKANYHHTGIMHSHNYEPYPIEINTDENGFRMNPHPETEKEKVLIIGDSYTQAVEVSDDKTYYSYLNKENYQTFSFGMAGYGNLQEYMILDKFIGKIDPSIVILQVCSNDFIDNHLELEKGANYKVGLRRPYLGDSTEIVYAHPLSLWDQYIGKTNFLSFVFQKIEKILNKYTPSIDNSSEKNMAELKDDFVPFKESKAKTKRIIKMIQDRVGKERKLLVINADAFEPALSSYAEICEDLSIPFLEFPIHQMNERRSKEEVYAIDGYHWNEVGHKIVAENLLKWLGELEPVVVNQ